jgi:hypothetical protein
MWLNDAIFFFSVARFGKRALHQVYDAASEENVGKSVEELNFD